MNNVSKIRRLFGLSQKDFGEAIGVTQGNVSHYEQGRQEMPPAVARRVIAAASERGLALRWDDIYGDPAQSPEAERHEAA